LKDQYVGDVNDFAKYQLLRLCIPAFEQVIVAWMLTGADGRTDGGRIGYLAKRDRREEDPALFDVLAEMIAMGERSVAGVERSGVLDGCHFEQGQIEGDPSARQRYFSRLAGLACANSLVFFDPDNGLEVPSVASNRQGSERYLYLEELGLFRDRGASVLVYQHFPRVNRHCFLDQRLRRLREHMGLDYVVFAAHSSQVAFLFALREKRARSLLASVKRRCAESRFLSFFEPATA
jgi:hypothetical protein